MTPTRSEELRRRSRRIFAWSFGVAVLLHVLLLFVVPWLRAEAGFGFGAETALLGSGGTDWSGVPVDVFFGPPAIGVDDDAPLRESDRRVLRASRRVPPPPGCTRTDWGAWEMARGEVRLRVNERGRVDSVAVTQSTSDPCWDGIMAGVAADLLYRWLPNEEHEAPVELFQPVTLSSSR